MTEFEIKKRKEKKDPLRSEKYDYILFFVSEGKTLFKGNMRIKKKRNKFWVLWH